MFDLAKKLLHRPALIFGFNLILIVFSIMLLIIFPKNQQSVFFLVFKRRQTATTLKQKVQKNTGK